MYTAEIPISGNQYFYVFEIVYFAVHKYLFKFNSEDTRTTSMDVDLVSLLLTLSIFCLQGNYYKPFALYNHQENNWSESSIRVICNDIVMKLCSVTLII